MKVQIEVDESAVGKTVEEILKNLPAEKQQEIAREVMKQWLDQNIHTNERALHEKEVIAKIRQDSYWRDKSEADIRTCHSFGNAMSAFRSSKEIMVKAISDEVISYYKEMVKDLVEKDPVLAAMREQVAQVVRESYPKMVHDALLHWFSGRMNAVMDETQNALRQIPDITSFQNKLADRLEQISGMRMR